jgi:hypothetical protein
MVSPLRKRERLATVLEIVRDAVEIAAITVAGFWAIYIFIYENRVKPSQGPPELVYSATMERLGEHGGLVAVRLQTETKNVGTVRVHFLGFSVTVLASRIDASPTPLPADATPTSNKLAAFYSATRPVPVYRSASLTHLADPSTGTDDLLDPGGVERADRIFYVPKGRFDLLVAFVADAYTKYDTHTVPTTMTIGPRGVPVFTANGDGIIQFRTDLTSLDLAKP